MEMEALGVPVETVTAARTIWHPPFANPLAQVPLEKQASKGQKGPRGFQATKKHSPSMERLSHEKANQRSHAGDSIKRLHHSLQENSSTHRRRSHRGRSVWREPA